MITQNANLLIFLIYIFVYFTQAQDDSCTMPDGFSKSKCVMLHRCDSFQNEIKKYKGKPPQDIVQEITSHICPGGVCCPDNVTAPDIELSIAELNLNLDQIRNHPSYHLINDIDCGISTTNRIVGGVVANLIEFPWAVLLGYRDETDEVEWDCGGNLINERYVLTAAHCIKNKLFKARLGEHTISTAPDCDRYGSCIYVQDILIDEKIKHEQYSRYSSKHDIALLKLASPANTKVHNVKTICLPTLQKADIEKIKYKNFTISGWGKSDNGNKSDTLLKSVVKLQDANQCLNSLATASNKVAVFEENICAGGYDKLHACRGDSGGGLTTTVNIDRKEKTYLYGLLARGVKCNSNGVFPDVYMNIKKYLGWILDNMS